MSNISYQFSSDDLRVKTGIGIRDRDVIRIPMTNGTALYGPYIDLPPGHYKAAIRFDPDTSCLGGAMMDVCAGFGNEQLAQQWITADQIRAEGMIARLDFSSPRPLRHVEARLLVNGEFSAGIVSVEIDGELAEASESLSVSISDLPKPSVENSVRKGRNLYEGYQRGIGLAFSNLGERIAADPDFGRARALAGSRTIVGDGNLANIFLLVKLDRKSVV